MAPFGLDLSPEIFSLFTKIIYFILTIFLVLAFYRSLTRTKTYGKKIIEIKEASLEVSNLLKDHTKRQILRSLSKERKYVSAISKEIGENAPRTRYHLNQLEKSRLVASFKLAREVYFALTKKGKWALDAINYYYPTTNLQWIMSRLNKTMEIFRIRRFIEKKKEEKIDEKT
ncbi:MAG: winged helix-turn-helix transcriptional regulator [Candidatus Aenigmarchaeota archaeon]|nr:winged helix-turn-helix transcriptional regulator [Candidatus Aenigmarchaeota archaeon]